jgi:hypothetical protein
MEKDLRRILELAVKSPSSHNTQPWKAKYGEHVLDIGYDPARQLFVGDPEKRELIMSIGCFLESIVLAAARLGYEARLEYVGESVERLVRIIFSNASPSEVDWISLIQERRSDRRLYETKPIPGQLISELRGLSVNSATLSLWTDGSSIEFLSQMTYEATEKIMSSQDFRDELANWVRNNWTKKPDGMPAFTQGMPGPVSLLAKTVISKNPKVAVSQAKLDSKRVGNSAAVAIIFVPQNGFANWLDAGRLYQKLCLVSLQNSIKTAGVSAAIVEEESINKIKQRFKLEAEPVALLRLGYKQGTVRSTPRLSVEDILA